MSVNVEVLKDQLWNEFLDSELNHRYFSELFRKMRRRDNWFKIITGLAGSGTVMALWFWKDHDLAWKIVTTSATILSSIVLPSIGWQQDLLALDAQAKIWGDLVVRYRNIDNALKAGRPIDELRVDVGVARTLYNAQRTDRSVKGDDIDVDLRENLAAEIRRFYCHSHT